MAGEERPDQEPTSDGTSREPSEPKSRRSFSKLRRELTDDELSSPAVQRLLLDELDRLEREASDYAQYRDRYHAADKKAGILDEKLKRWQAAEIAHVLCLTAGSALVGYAPAIWDKAPSGYVTLAIGVILVLGAVVAKARQS